MSATKRLNQIEGWGDEEEDNNLGAPWTNFGPYEREMRVYYATTYNQTVIAADEAEAIQLTRQGQQNFHKIFKDIGTLKVNSNFKAGIYKAQA